MLTNILVRPAARGGKYLGPDAANKNNNSAAVALFDVDFKEIITAGLTKTSPPVEAGPTNLMSPVARCNPYATDENTVGIKLSVDIDKPTQLWLVAVGPLSYPTQSACTISLLTVLPGVDIGTSAFPEGIVIEIPGLCISNATATLTGNVLNATATVTMMCGCKINDTANWPWPPTDFTIQLNTITKNNVQHAYQLEYDSSETSTFCGSWPNEDVNDPITRAWITAFEPKLGNAGCYWITEPLLAQENQTIQKVFKHLGI